jgi:cholesterol transport system auxiliary component
VSEASKVSVRRLTAIRIFGGIALTVSALALTGCGTALTGATPPALDTITLGAPDDAAKFRGSKRQILVAEPKALKIYDSQNIVVATSSTSLEYLGGSQWADRLPSLVQAKLAETFQDAGAGIGLPGQGLAIDYQVITEIRDFSIRVDGSDRARVVIFVKLLNDRTGDVVADQLFEAEVPASESAYPAALNSAFGDVAGQVTSWLAKRI